MTEQTPSEVVFIDDPRAPEFFATKYSGVFIHAGNIHITFEAPRVNHETSPGPINRVIVCRIVMPVGGVADLAVGLTSFLQSHGIDPLAPPPIGTPIQ